MEPPPGVAPPDRDPSSSSHSTIANNHQTTTLLGLNASAATMIPVPSATTPSSLSVSPGAAGPSGTLAAASASVSSVSLTGSNSGAGSGQPPIDRLSRPMSFDKVFRGGKLVEELISHDSLGFRWSFWCARCKTPRMECPFAARNNFSPRCRQRLWVTYINIHPRMDLLDWPYLLIRPLSRVRKAMTSSNG